MARNALLKKSTSQEDWRIRVVEDWSGGGLEDWRKPNTSILHFSSSSEIRRKVHLKAAAFSKLAFHCDKAPMALDDPVDH